MTPPPPARRARRALGPGAARVLADTVRTPRTPPPWSPAAVEGALRAVLERFEATAEPWRAADAGRTEDVHRRRARQALLEAIARHHHGPVPDEEPDDRPW
ncbi:hypothetical protein ACFWA9_32095 [Kitasatospora sp. NPDC059973]|uniref:hypothetical protein n=1 Tax=Kitasatospora sp. NPDC059973 TaxID=3347020 RepID=UPI0036979107